MHKYIEKDKEKERWTNKQRDGLLPRQKNRHKDRYLIEMIGVKKIRQKDKAK